jgi:phage terminase large subunit-like protein
MMESMLLLLLALGGGNGSPAASPYFAPTPGFAAPVTGVWRGQWVAPGEPADHVPVAVEAVFAPGKDAGTLIGLVVSGLGRERRTARLAGRYDRDGARLALPSGGALRLIAESATRLVGEVKVGGAAGVLPGDGALELARVRR